MDKIKTCGRVISQVKLTSDVYSMWIEAPAIAEQVRAGQFISVYSKDSARLLPRPISVCEILNGKRALRIVYRVVGAGTNEFSGYQANDRIAVLGPLGNGFLPTRKRAFLVGGGIGIPPMLELAKTLDCEKQMILGYRDELYLNKDFAPYGEVYLATEDGSAGTKGNVLDAIRSNDLKAEVIYACGPAPMLRALKAYAEEQDIECWLSLEERMACGIGACLACVCKSTAVDEHSQVHNKRICKDGPVFSAKEVVL